MAAIQVLLEKDSDDKQVERLMMQMDGDGDGYVTLDEFKQWWIDTEDKAHHHYMLGARASSLVTSLRWQYAVGFKTRSVL